MAGALQKHGLTLNGLVLISAALDFSTFIYKRGHDLPYQLFLPSFAATAWYHDLLPEKPESLATFVDEVRVWTIAEYGPALMMGAQLNANRKAALAEQLYAYTGVPAADWIAADLRIVDMHFAKRALGIPGQTVGRLDSRYVGPDTEPLHHTAQNDPSFDAPHGPYTSLINGYLRRTLGFDPPERYVVFSFGVNEGWSWAGKGLEGFPSTADDLRQTLIHNPHLKVLVANGYYDLATPFFAAEHSIDHLGINAATRENVTLTYYESGHMMYLHPPSRAQLRADLVAFYQGAKS
jgi:carboxypeptidase C (cathepsin A)